MEPSGQESATPPYKPGVVKTNSMSQTHPHHRRKSRQMKRSRSAPDCKHSIASKVKIGLCAMDKKAQSKPMCEIIARLTAGGEFEIISFGDQVIVECAVEDWPLCDVMLSWHSEGFPLKKAQAYVELRRPFLINDVHMQDVLLDRRRVYKTLMDNNIPVPRHILVNREAPVPESDDELTTSSGSAGSSPRAASPAPPTALSPYPAAGSPLQRAAGDQVCGRSSQTGSTGGLQSATGGAQLAMQSSTTSSSGPGGHGRSSTTGIGVVLPDPPEFVEGEDYVELDGVRIDKPFVEKPVSGEDHNIYIYYPHSMGGGVKRLFRKVDNKSADYDPHHPGTVRRDGSYIYEEFLTTGGTDVKVYTVGPRYAHAEARKSPVVDGKVNRTPDGKEVRFPVLLSPQEKEIARMVCLAFGQRVCGFDLLRSETGRSYVCDVNGWSFVKNSKKYYDDAAGILRSIILSQVAPHRLAAAPEGPLIPLAGLLEEVAANAAASEETPHHNSTGSFDEDMPGSPSAVSAPSGAAGVCDGQASASGMDADAAGMREVVSLQDMTNIDGIVYDDDGATDDSSSTAGTADSHRWLELRCVLAVIRHGDRTPKQKMKVTVTQAPLLELFEKYKDSKGKQAKLKSPGQLQELLDVTRQLLTDMEARSSSGGGAAARNSSSGAEDERQQELHEELREKLRIVRTVLEQGGTFSGINRKVQLKPTKWSRKTRPSEETGQQQQQQQGADSGEQQVVPSEKGDKEKEKGGDDTVVTELLLILKYGGVLTHAGRVQAEELGKMFRMVMYPRYGPAGGGLLRLHSTYRHDMKIYSSDEGRVQMSAAAFIQGMLDLEGSSLTPILVSLVTKNASMLDAFGKGASDDILNAKNTLYKHLTWDHDKATSLCSKLALPLNTPANSSPPPSPKRAKEEEAGKAAATTSDAATDGGRSSPILTIPRSRVSPQSEQPTAAAAAAALPTLSSSTAATLYRLPTTTSCLDLLQQGQTAATSSNNSDSPPQQQQQPQQQQPPSLKHSVSHGGGSLAATAALNAANAAVGAASSNNSSPPASVDAPKGSAVSSGAVLSRLGSSSSGWAHRAAEARAAAVSGIKTMPERPLALLYRLVDLMKVLVDELREKCLEERQDLGAGSSSISHYSSLTTAPDDWRLDEARPCSGERLLLMFDRWRKLLKSFYNEKKQQFDISKVPDIYDSAKYDAIHNSHLNLSIKELYTVSRQLASVVVPHEYGLDGPGKLLIGSKICAELLGKLMCDLDSMKEESIITAAIEAETAAARAAAAAADRPLSSHNSKNGRHRTSADSSAYDAFDTEFGQMSLADERMRPFKPAASWTGSNAAAAVAASGGMNHSGSVPNTPSAAAADTDAANTFGKRLQQQRPAGRWSNQDGQQQQQQQQDEEGRLEQEETETLHRLCPTYASDINSPLRHVRTRIYFTSESHIHSLLNVLRYCHLPYPHAANSSSSGSSITPAPSGYTGNISQQHSGNAQQGAAAAALASTGSSAAAAAAVTADGTTAAVAVAATPAGSAAVAMAGQGDASSSSSAFASVSGSAVASAAAGPDHAAAAAAAVPQPLVNADGQALLDDTDEFDYLTHIVFRMYENKQAPVDAPERFFVEIQFSNGANYDPTTVVPVHDNHVLPTQPRRPLTDAPGVPLQTLQELLGKYARGKNTPSNYQLQVALRAPGPLSVSSSHAPSKLPTPGVSRQPSGPLASSAAAMALMAAGPGTVTSAALPADVAARAVLATAAAVGGGGGGTTLLDAGGGGEN